MTDTTCADLVGVAGPVITAKDGTHVSVAHVQESDGASFIVQSPYTERDHQLDLRSVSAEDALLAQALCRLECLREDYATSPYVDTFNWGHVMVALRDLAREGGKTFGQRSYYIVAFRSQIPPSTQYSELGALDKAAHAEAVASGGFLKYWFGSPDSEGRNLATCVWSSRADAVKAGLGPDHRKASRSTHALYTSWKIDRHRLVIDEGAEGWRIIDWVD